MKYFIDTEFIEGKQKESFPISLFRDETVNTIDLISIGIVAEDGREYYAISKDFNLNEAWNRFQIDQENHIDNRLKILQPELYSHSTRNVKVYWLRENVLRPIYYELIGKDIDFHDYDRFFTYKAFKNLIEKKGKTNKEIASEIRDFVMEKNIDYGVGSHTYSPIEFYAYYADYDWVVFCWLFGKMMDLPSGFPMYCKDLKQMLDEKQNQIDLNTSVTEPRKDIKSHKDYPQQDPSKSHNAIEDARWNKQLFKFLNKL